ncbi:MAG: ATP synthase F1 subunit delta [Balneolaceae bacterium]|nr:MAG: ATP synthase F1 subunit delta [Balneolaceae bacterium]
MVVKKVAHRYASALFHEAKNRNEVDAVARDMQRISESISGSSELLLFLRSQIISREIKANVLTELFDKDLSEISRSLVRLILEKRREDQLPGITHLFGQLYKKEQGLQDIEVLVAKRPGSEQTELLKKALEKKTGGKVLLSFREDPSLKGGMAIRIDDTVIDGTVKHKLQQLEASFQKAGM